MPRIEVSFEIDVNGMFSVEASDTATGRRRAMTIVPSGGFTQAELSMAAGPKVEHAKEKQQREKEGVEASLDDLRNALKEMEKAAAIIGQVMLRP